LALDRALFIRRNTVVAAPPLVPEIRLHLLRTEGGRTLGRVAWEMPPL